MSFEANALERIHRQIMWNRLIAVVEEQAQIMIRTAFSTTVREAGDLTLLANTRDSLASIIYLVGTMPGFGTDEIPNFTNYCDALSVGRWTYPNVLFPQTSVPAGTYRLKFVTDASSTPGHLIGWGGDGSTTLTVPVRAHTARFRFETVIPK